MWEKDREFLEKEKSRLYETLKLGVLCSNQKAQSSGDLEAIRQIFDVDSSFLKSKEVAFKCLIPAKSKELQLQREVIDRCNYQLISQGLIFTVNENARYQQNFEDFAENIRQNVIESPDAFWNSCDPLTHESPKGLMQSLSPQANRFDPSTNYYQSYLQSNLQKSRVVESPQKFTRHSGGNLNSNLEPIKENQYATVIRERGFTKFSVIFCCWQTKHRQSTCSNQCCRVPRSPACPGWTPSAAGPTKAF